MSIFDALKASLKSLENKEPEVATCISCHEEITWSNTCTEDGWKEAGISGLCEVCFDNFCFEPLAETIKDCITFNSHNKDLLTLVKSTEGVFLAGGALRQFVDPNDEVCDYDLFFTDKTAIPAVRKSLADLGFGKVFECPQGDLFSYKDEYDRKVQLICKWEYGSIKDAVDTFDITAAAAAWDGTECYRHRRFIFDTLNQRISLNSVTYPKATLNRIVKYVRKGYTLTRDANELFIYTVNDMELTDENDIFYID